jgi:ATP-dependent exoDNAse (exonuclease V) alpha subunit
VRRCERIAYVAGISFALASAQRDTLDEDLRSKTDVKGAPTSSWQTRLHNPQTSTPNSTMAIYHLDMKPISRASGRSAVAAAAYRAGVTLTNDRDGLMHIYEGRSGIVHAEIVIPAGSSATWALNRSALWNTAEAAERRADARVAREIEIALPHELTAAQRLAATRELAQHVSDRFGVAVDFAIHTPQGASDIRNYHAHLMMSVRAVEVNGLGAKTSIERENKWLLGRNLPTSQMQLREIRQAWEGITNRALAAAGHDISVDHRSHAARGLMLEPTAHVGVHATDMARAGLSVSRVRLTDDAAHWNAEQIRDKPELLAIGLCSSKTTAIWASRMACLGPCAG